MYGSTSTRGDDPAHLGDGHRGEDLDAAPQAGPNGSSPAIVRSVS